MCKTRNPEKYFLKWEIIECGNGSTNLCAQRSIRLCVVCNFIFRFTIVRVEVIQIVWLKPESVTSSIGLTIWRRTLTANVTHLTDFTLNYVNSHQSCTLYGIRVYVHRCATACCCWAKIFNRNPSIDRNHLGNQRKCHFKFHIRFFLFLFFLLFHSISERLVCCVLFPIPLCLRQVQMNRFVPHINVYVRYSVSRCWNFSFI